MKILTVSASPYLLKSEGRIHSYALQHLCQGHEVLACCWDHECSYYMKEDDGNYYYDLEDGQRFCQIVPVGEPKTAAKTVYDAAKDFNPDVILTIGCPRKTSYVSQILSALEKVSAWAALAIPRGNRISDEDVDRLRDADLLLVTNRSSECVLHYHDLVAEKLPLGPDTSVFHTSDVDKKYLFAARLTNDFESDIGSFAYMASEAGFETRDAASYLNINIHDEGGFLNVRDVLEHDGAMKNVVLPSRFSSIYKGMSDEEWADILRQSCYYVDPSMDSTTGLGAMEAVACGCYPVISGSIYNGLLPEDMPDGFIGQCRDIYGERGNLLTVMDSMEAMKHVCKKGLSLTPKLSEKECSHFTKGYSRSRFVIDLEKAIGRIAGKRRPTLVVETIARS